MHAAEDAFQATFLALARKPRAVRDGAALAGWLHRVAVRIANKLLATRRLQRRTEQLAAREMSVPPVNCETPEIAAVLDQEIDRLPDRLRRAVVLCYLDGRTTEQAAQLLGCPRGTVNSRLAAARERLRVRLKDRGLSLPVAGITATLFATESPAGLIPAAVSAALGGASPVLIGLVQGVFHAMLMTKVKIATAVVLGVGLAGTGVGWVAVPGSGPAIVQADEVLQQDIQATAKKPTADDAKAFSDEIQKSYALILEAKKTLGENLSRAQKEYEDFRLKIPTHAFGKESLTGRIDRNRARWDELTFRKTEAQSRLQTIRSAIKPAQNNEDPERVARATLLKLHLRGIDVTAMKKVVAGEGKEMTAAEFLTTYATALQSEIEETSESLKQLDDLLEVEIKAARDMSHYEVQEERLRNAILSQRKLFDSIVKRLQEINVRKDKFIDD